jgi:beta-galactosidase
MFKRLTGFLFLPLFTGITFAAAHSETLPFSERWHFLRADEPQAASAFFDDARWEIVTLPHTARVEALPAGKQAPQWQGICWYRRAFDLSREAADKSIILRFDGAMNTAEFWVNGKSAGRFMGGYLPCVMDITSLAKPGGKNVVAVRLDNRDNPVTGPKPLADLDFNLYSGLYRSAHLIIKDRLHITEPILADKVAGGGVFVTFPEVSKEAAAINIKTHIKNAEEKQRAFTLRNTLLDASGNSVAAMETSGESLGAGKDREIQQQMRIAKPHLWSPNSPYLYHLRTELIAGGKRIDSEENHVGVRRIEIAREGFRINGEKMFLRGCNRHQEYPYIGNALSDAAQYRDALKIKEAGFDYVRLSHYPQSPAFLDACDELGIVVMNCLMGWQFFAKDPAFAELKYRECRQLVRRDRNHPSVILWEVSLNESHMPKPFIERTHAIAHEEYPGDQCYTCGWMPGYDVFIQARQHGGCRKVQDQPCVVSEYGDWEYYAQNAGLEQHRWKDLRPAERSSRQVRGDGEVRLLQQAINFQEAHNDNLKTRAFADGIWVMFDYSRGYAGDIEASGVMDAFRLPKFAYWFFRSQRDAGELVAQTPVGPMVFLATYWTAASPLEVRVFSNCEEVSLSLNDKLLERRRPDVDRTTTNLVHAPFTFRLNHFEAGTLRAAGYIGGREVAGDERRTPGLTDQLRLRFDLSGRPFTAGGKDAVFAYAELLDGAGTVVSDAALPVFLGTVGDVRLVGRSPVLSEAGVGTILLQSDTAKPRCALYALSLVREQGCDRVLSAAASPDHTEAPGYTIHYTVDGTEPSAASRRYCGPVTNAPQLRAALLVGGRRVALADSRVNSRSSGDRAGLGH